MANQDLKKIINRETILYTLFGLLTSVLNIIIFKLLLILQWDYKMANLVTLLIVKLSAYICNKNFVFCSKTESLIELIKEFSRFVIARGLTMLIDYFGLILFVEVLKGDKMLSKCFLTGFVIVLNYFIGKKHVFVK